MGDETERDAIMRLHVAEMGAALRGFDGVPDLLRAFDEMRRKELMFGYCHHAPTGGLVDYIGGSND